MKISFMYIIIPLIVLFVVPRISYKSKDNRKIIIWMFGISYMFLCGLRDGGGADDDVYRLYYENGYGGDIWQIFEGKEPLFNALRLCCGFLGLNYKGLFFAYSVITAVFMCKALINLNIDKNSLVIYIASFYFISFPGMFTTMRQACAMALLIYMYTCNDLSWKRRLILWLAIICVHYGFAILLPLEIIFNIKYYKVSNTFRVLVPILALIAGMFVNLNSIIRFVTDTLGIYSYMNSEDNYNHAAGVGVVTFSLFVLYLLKNIFMYLPTRKSMSETVDKSYLLIQDKINIAQMMYFSLMFLTMNIRWGNRICYYYLLFVPFLIDDVLSLVTINGSKSKIRFMVLIALYIGFIWIMMQYFGADGYKWSLNFWS